MFFFFLAGGDTKSPNVTLLGIQSQRLQASATTIKLNDRAMQHPLCTQNTSAYVGQTAKMYCCLARLDRELSVSTIFTYEIYSHLGSKVFSTLHALQERIYFLFSLLIEISVNTICHNYIFGNASF